MVRDIANPIISAVATLMAGGSLWTALGVANELENEVLSTKQQQKVIIQTQQEIKSELKDRQKTQQEIRDLLIQLKTTVENQ